MAITVGHVDVKITVDASGVQRGVSAAENSLKGLERSASGVGSVMQGVFMGAGIAMFGGIVSGVQGAIKATTDYEKTLSGISSVMDRTAADFQSDFAIVRATTLQLGADTAFSSSQAARGVEELVKAGINVKEVYGGGVQASLALAAAGNVDVGESAVVSAGFLNAWGLKGKDMGEVSDYLAGSMNASSLSLKDLGLAAGQGAAVAAKAGISYKDFTAVITKMGQENISGAVAGTSFRNMLLQLASPTDKARALTKELGLQWKDSSGQLKDAAGIAEELKGKLGGMSDLDQIDIANKLFGVDGGQAALTLMKAGREGIEGVHTAIQAVGAEEVAKERLNNLAGDMDALGGSAETLAIKFGQALDPALRAGTKMMTDFINSVSSNPMVIDFITDLGNSLVTLGNQAKNALGVLTTTGDAREGFLQALGLDEGTAASVGTFMDTTQRRVEEGVAAIRGVFTSTGGDRAGFLESLGLTQKQATDAGAILDSIQGSFEKLGGSIKTVWDAASPIVTNIVDGLTKALGGMGGQGTVKDLALLQGALEAANRELKIFAADLERSKQQQDQQGPGFAKIFEDVDESLTKTTSASHQMGTILRGELMELGEVAQATWITMSANAGQGFSTIGGDAKMIFEGIGETVRTVFVASAAVIGGFLHGLEEGFSAAGRQIGRFFELLQSGDISGAVTAFSNIGSALQDGFRSGFESREREITEGVNSFFTGIGTTIATTGEAITNSINSVMDSSASSTAASLSSFGSDIDTTLAAANAAAAYHGEQWVDVAGVVNAAAADATAAVAAVGTETEASVAAAHTALTNYQGDVSGWAAANQAVVAEGTQQWTQLASEWPEQAWATAQAGLGNYQAGLSGFLEQNGAAILAATPFWQQSLSEWVNTATQQATGYFSTYFAMVVSTMNNLTTAMQGIAQGTWIAALSDWVPSATAAVTGGLSAMVASMMGILAGAAGQLRAAGSTMGAAVVQGFMAGFESQKGSAEAAVSAWAGRVSAAARATLAVASPSKVFADIGSETVQGFIVGLGDMEPAAIAAVEGLADTTMGAGKRRFGGLALDTGEVIGRGIADGITASVGVVQSALFNLTGRVAEFFQEHGIEAFGGGDWRPYLREQAGLLEHEGSAVMADAMINIATHAGEVYSEGAQESLDKATVKISRTVQRGQLQIADDLDAALVKALSDLQKNLAEAGEKAGDGAAKAVAAAHRKFNEAVEKGATGAALAKHQLTLEQDLREAAEKSSEAGAKAVRDAYQKYDGAVAQAHGQSDNKFRQLQQQAVLSRESAIESAWESTASTNRRAIEKASEDARKAAEKAAEEARKHAEKIATAQAHLAMTPEIIAAGYAAYEAEAIKEGRAVNTAVLATISADFLGKAETELAQVGESAADAQMRAYRERGIKEAQSAAEAVAKAQAEAAKTAHDAAENLRHIGLMEAAVTSRPDDYLKSIPAQYGAPSQAVMSTLGPGVEFLGGTEDWLAAIRAQAGIVESEGSAVMAAALLNIAAFSGEVYSTEIQEQLDKATADISRTLQRGQLQIADTLNASLNKATAQYQKDVVAAHALTGDAQVKAYAEATERYDESVAAAHAQSNQNFQQLQQQAVLSRESSIESATQATINANREASKKASEEAEKDAKEYAEKLAKTQGHVTMAPEIVTAAWAAYTEKAKIEGFKANTAVLDAVSKDHIDKANVEMAHVGESAAEAEARAYKATSIKEMTGAFEAKQKELDELAKKAGEQAGRDFGSEFTGAVNKIMIGWNPFSGIRSLTDLWASYAQFGSLAKGADGQKSFAEQVYDWRKANPYSESDGWAAFERPGPGTADAMYGSWGETPRGGNLPTDFTGGRPSNPSGINSQNSGPPGQISLTPETIREHAQMTAQFLAQELRSNPIEARFGNNELARGLNHATDTMLG